MEHGSVPIGDWEELDGNEGLTVEPIRLNRTPEERELFGGSFYLPKPRRLSGSEKVMGEKSQLV